MEAGEFDEMSGHRCNVPRNQNPSGLCCELKDVWIGSAVWDDALAVLKAIAGSRL